MNWRATRRNGLVLTTANQPFGAWDAIFPDKTMTVAAIDRIVHHAAIFEMNVESFRRRSAMDRVAKTPAVQNNQTATG